MGKHPLTSQNRDPLTLVDLAPYLPKTKGKGDAAKPVEGANSPAGKPAAATADAPKPDEPILLVEPLRKRAHVLETGSRRAAGSLASAPATRGATRPTFRSGTPPPLRPGTAPPLRPGTAPPLPSSPSAPVPPDAIPEWLKKRARVLEERAERRRARLRTPPDELSLYTEIEMPEGMRKLVSQVAALIIFSLCGAIIFTLRWENVDFYWYRPFLNAYSIGVASFILSRFVIALFYRPPKNVGLEPPVSIVITAFNEEDAIRRTIAACYAADYPREKLEVIVVDDGSTDGTVRELERCTRRWPDLVVEKFEKNKGKREAMAAGARIAKGEILLYVDSDSFIRRDGIRAMVQGFADPRVAAVAGHTDVANARVNALTRMQDVRYYVAFRVMKAAESVFGAVTCCPGCFSAYRKDCMREVLDAWLHQHFLGVQATFGDDRSLTNFLLRKYKVIYSSAAVATTIVPEHHKKFLKQQLRWKKSWLRECLIAATFMWKKHPLAAVAFYAQLLFPIIAPILVLRAFVWLPLVGGDVFSIVIYTFGVLMIGLIFSCYYLFYKADGLWIYGAHFTIYYMFVLIWQMPYAIATSRDNRWGTR
jgi:hyaluronan synthase